MLSTVVSAAAAFCAPLRPLGAAAAFELTARPTMTVAWSTPLHAASRERASAAVAMRIIQPDDPCNDYAVLGVKPGGASHKELKRAYHERAKQCHPDLNPSAAAAEEFQLLTAVRDRPARLLTER